MSKFEISLSKDDLEHIANGYDIKLKMKILSLTKIANITSRRKKKRKIPFLKEISSKIDGRFKEVTE